MRQALVLLAALWMATPAWAQQAIPPMQGPFGPTVEPAPTEPRGLQPTAVQGKIKNLDRVANTLTLDDGTTLMIPESIAATGLKEGARVIVTYEGRGGQKVVTSVIQVRETSES